MALKRVNFATAHDASTFTSARWNFQPVPDGFGGSTIQLVEIPPGNPRFAHNPATGEAEGILIEEERTNVVRYSRLGEGQWATAQVTLQNAENLTEVFATMNTGKRTVLLESLPIDSQTYARQVIFKPAAGLRYFSLGGQSSNGTQSGDRTAVFDIETGNSIGLPVTLENLGSNTWRAILILESGGAANRNVTFGVQSSLNLNADGIPASNDKLCEILYAGAEVGTQATSPIITNGTAITRTADIVARTLGAEYNDNQGTFIITANAKIGDVLLRCGSLEIVADVDGEKTYTASYTSALNATVLEVCPDAPSATVSNLKYEPKAV